MPQRRCCRASRSLRHLFSRALSTGLRVTVARLRQWRSFIPMRHRSGVSSHGVSAYDSCAGKGSRRPQLALFPGRHGVKWTGPACGGRSVRQLLQPYSVTRVRPAPRRWKALWRRPIATIRRSTPSAPRCARPTRPCRRRSPITARASPARSTPATSISNRSRPPAATTRGPTPTSARAAAISGWCRPSITASAAAISRARPKPRCSPDARPCAMPSRPRCSTPRPPT